MAEDKDNVFKLLPGGGNPDELKQLLKLLRDQKTIQMQLQIEMAQLTRHKYLQLIAAGFQPAEALEIIKVSPV